MDYFNKGINKIILEYYVCKPKFLSELLTVTSDIKRTLNTYNGEFFMTGYGKFYYPEMKWFIKERYFKVIQPMGDLNYSRF